jgi:L-phenylalanine/L-methionine N-acetyltransferase
MGKSDRATVVSIRHAEPGDYLAIHRIQAGPNAVRGTLQLPYASAERWRTRLAEPAAGVYHLLACVGDDVVGHLGLETFAHRPRRQHAGEIGIAVRDDWQAKGIGTALLRAAIDMADNWLQLTRLELTVYTDNAAAVALYEKCGFVIEGRLERYAFRDGEFVDVYSMARLRTR